MGALQSFLLGSVARKLVSNAPCHVLVARSSRGLSAEESLAALDSAPKLAVVLGADGSAGSEKAAEFIRRQGPLAFQELTAVCAEPLGVVPAGIDPAAFVDLYQYDHERAEEIARRVAEDLGSCADRVDSATGLGRPGWVISEQAKARGSDLIVVGATRHGTIERFLIGSASYELATEAACSVLIIRPSKI
jgi:nucleotide-binding universal stress UspA family protein